MFAMMFEAGGWMICPLGDFGDGWEWQILEK